jgi:type II secretory pathway pseudopilin PulG
MLFKFVVTISFLFPLVGVRLMENGAYGLSVLKRGYPNGATWAFLLYCSVAFATVLAASKLGLFCNVGKGRPQALRHPGMISLISLLLMVSMLGFLLFGLGGIDNYYRITNAGTFRAALSGVSGALGSIILKYVAPALFAFALMTNVAWNPNRVKSVTVLLLALVMMLIGGSYGFKSSFVLAVLPAAMLYYWRSSPWTLLPLGVAAVCVILLGYVFFAGSLTIGDALDSLVYRLFVLQGDAAWWVWDLHREGEPLPAYTPTLLPMIGDRIFSLVTGITRDKQLEWVMSHFGLMITHLSGYSTEAILAGHNNTGTVFSEGVIAGGLLGVVMFAILAGLIVNLLYNFIENRLEANDFAWASVAASYAVVGVMAWLLSGGVSAIIHISIPVLLLGTYMILHLIRRTAGEVKQHVPMRRKRANLLRSRTSSVFLTAAGGIALVSLSFAIHAKQTTLDTQRKADLEVLKSAMEAYFKDHGTYLIRGAGSDGQTQGWINQSYPGGISVVEALHKGGHLPVSSLDDPTGRAGYMIYLCEGSTRYSISATLKHPSAEDISRAQTSCNAFGENGTYQVYGKNYAVGLPPRTDAELDWQRKSDLQVLQSAMEAYFKDHGTYLIRGAGSYGETQGWINQPYREAISVVEALHKGGYLAVSSLDDPTGTTGYMIFLCEGSTRYSISATLKNPSAEDISHAQTSCNAFGENGAYEVYGKNYAVGN